MKHGQPVLKLGSLSPGDIVAVPLTNGLFAHGRIYRDAIGIYRGLSDALKTAEGFRGKKPNRFFYYMSMPGNRYEKDWRFIGHIPFAADENSHPPPMHERDDCGLCGTRIYHRGEFYRATTADVRGLQIYTIYSPPALRSYLEGERSDPFRTMRTRLEKARRAAGGSLPDDGVLAGLGTRGDWSKQPRESRSRQGK